MPVVPDRGGIVIGGCPECASIPGASGAIRTQSGVVPARFFFEISLVCGFATSHAACEHSPDTVAGSRAVVTGADTGNADARSQRQAQ